jgi:hypothetical protein
LSILCLAIHGKSGSLLKRAFLQGKTLRPREFTFSLAFLHFVFFLVTYLCQWNGKIRCICKVNKNKRTMYRYQVITSVSNFVFSVKVLLNTCAPFTPMIHPIFQNVTSRQHVSIIYPSFCSGHYL